MGSFEGQVAVVTGANSGIGEAIALELAGQGAQLCLLGRDAAALHAVAQAASKRQPQALCYRTDLGLDGGIEEFVLSVQRDIGQVDMLIHSAGVIALGAMEAASMDDFDRQFRINVRAPYKLTQSLLPMLKKTQGQIVFINSSAGFNARASVGQYAATKHALKAISDSLREEVNGYGIRVMSVYPGRTATRMQAEIHAAEGKPYFPEALLQPADVAREVVHALSLPRTAEVTDIHIRPMIKPKVT
jgi:NADP-dependent 3-hydroxy acid dehydrogenase YdfG